MLFFFPVKKSEQLKYVMLAITIGEVKWYLGICVICADAANFIGSRKTS